MGPQSTELLAGPQLPHLAASSQRRDLLPLTAPEAAFRAAAPVVSDAPAFTLAFACPLPPRV